MMPPTLAAVWPTSAVALSTPTSLQPQSRFVDLSPSAFRVAWVGILALHVTCVAYFAFWASLYHLINGTYLDVCLDFYEIGMKNTHYATLSNTHAVVASCHAVFALIMIVWSLYKRRWSFGPFTSVLQGRRQGAIQSPSRRHLKSPPRKPRWWRRVYDLTFARRGLCGMESPYFEAVLIVRECIETALLTMQAHRMSLHLSRIWLNRVYVALLVLNCWMTPLIDRFVTRDVMRRRLLCLLSDAVLDLFTSVGVPTILLATYVPDYSIEIKGFDTYFWYNEYWVVNVLNEFQLILVSSWLDLASRIVFSVGFLGSLQGIKNTLRERSSGAAPASSAAVSTSISSVQSSVASERGKVVDDNDRLEPVEPAGIKRLKTSLVQAFPVLETWGTRARHATSLFFRWLFIAWGLGVLITHLHAETKPTLRHCLMQLYPWFQSSPACALVLSDCYQNRHTGEAALLAAEWLSADPTRTARVLIRHCSQLAMPPELQALPALRGIKIYNSTIVNWDDAAALTNAKHPALMMLLLVRIEFQDGVLPSGLLSREFPAMLWDIELCATNLRALPEDLDQSWLVGAYLYLEQNKLRGVPPVLARLAPTQLSLADNGLTQFPFEVLDWDGLEYFSVSRNAIKTLVPSSSTEPRDRGTLKFLYLVDTLVDSLPRWIDAFFTRPKSKRSLGRIAMTRTPLCKFVREMASGHRLSFPPETREPAADHSIVMNVTSVDDDLLLERVSCVYNESLFYPIEYEDKWQQIQ
ncbi:hypothetical protein PINS_up000917 [Pythium insidiosum]|nr:hypothetical protein PINS_up000917 [Pythium insidiosum]